MNLPGGYDATRDEDGILTIHHVPIFVECTRGDFDADRKWVQAAAASAKDSEQEGYLAPLHIRHHGAATEVRPAGFFRVLGTETITFQGERRLAIFADLIVTDPGVQEEVLQRRLPYRSVEIFDVDKPSIDSLALLDHEAPYLQLPMLMVRNLQDRSASVSSIAYASVAQPWESRELVGNGRVVACFSHGRSAHVLLQDRNDMTTKNAKKAASKTSMQFADGEDKAKDFPPKKEGDASGEVDESGDGGDGAAMDSADAATDVKKIVADIQSGAISVADMQAIVAAIQAMDTSGQQAQPVPPDPNMQPAPAPAPGQAMKAKEPNKMSENMAKQAGEIEALKARLTEREASDARRTDVADAVKRLEGRPLGSDVEAKLELFHKTHGAKAFKDYVEAMVTTFAAHEGEARAVGAVKSAVPEVAMKYHDQGAEAVDRAAKFAREHAELVSRGHTRMAVERYVEINMARRITASAG